MAARHRLSRVRAPLLPDAFVPWIPMAVGVAVMAGYVIYALTLQAGTPPEDTEPAGPWPAHEVPSPAATVGEDYPAGGQRARAVAPSLLPPPPPPSPSPSPSPTPSPTPEVASNLVASYRLEESRRHSFIGKVVIVNWSRQAEDWTVVLEFPGNVGELRSFWVGGPAQPTMSRAGDGYEFTGATPVEPWSWVVLRVHFDRSGHNVEPIVCAVNGNPCT